ncbi:PQQ-binding-like beta-propeller repeat protein [Streptomyces sp. NPDC050418]|uniref:outer membrane protein assembly factor BamB family protein n=1 Tax=Streptomyces sp. NPDC050418 TaxID=3365612 RepID=UPI0037B413D2
MTSPPEPPRRDPDARPLSEFSHSNARPRRPLSARLPRWERRTVLTAGAALAALLLVGSGVYAVSGDDTEGGKGRTEAGDAEKPPASAPPGAGSTRPPLPEDINAGLKTGEAKAWLGTTEQDLPPDGRGYTPWFVDDLVIRAVYREVTAFKVTDGSKAWSITLPAAICDTPAQPTPDGKVVVAYQGKADNSGGRCNHLQMIDLKKGAGGWRKKLDESGRFDSTITVRLAITGNTVAVARDMIAEGYRVSDGKRLFGLAEDSSGGCAPDDVAGGTKLLVLDHCSATDPGFGQIKEVDPKSGKIAWRYRPKDAKTKKTRQRMFGTVYSVDPPVVSVHTAGDRSKWSVLSLTGNGKLRSAIDFGKYAFAECPEGADSARGALICSGGAVGKDLLYLSAKPGGEYGNGRSRIVAFDLDSGKIKWTSEPAENRPMLTVGIDGSSVIGYVKADSKEPGRLVRIGPKGEEPKTVMKLGTTAHPLERLAGSGTYRDGRFFLPVSVSPDDDMKEQAQMLSYGSAG